MHAHQDPALTPLRAGGRPDDQTLLAGLLVEPADRRSEAPWAAPARLAPAPTRAPNRRPAARKAALPMAAATALLAGGIVAASIGATPARAAYLVAPASVPGAAKLAPAGGALAGVRVAAAAPDEALLARLLAAPTAADEALLAGMLAEPVAVPAFELAAPAASAPAAPAAVAFNTVAKLPRTAFAYRAVAVDLPAVTVADQERNYPRNAPLPPAPPVVSNTAGQQQQPPPPPGYVQPPGYQDGVPFGGQPGAVPGSRPVTRPPTSNARPPVRPTASVYVVRAGDTLAGIALRFYGDTRYAAVIWEYNFRVIGANPNAIFPGQRLTLPVIGGRPPAANLTPLPDRGPIAQRSLYTIQPRDFLRWMAQRAYGNEMLWPEIYQANRNVLGSNPDLIYPDVTVFIP